MGLGCRATGEKDLCGTCAEYRQTVDRIEAQGGTAALADARRRAPWGRRLIVGLVAVDLIALGGFLVPPGLNNVAVVSTVNGRVVGRS